MRLLLPLVAIVFLFSSCNEYQKALKNESIKEKYDMAEKLYNEGDYKRATRLFEQIAPQYAGKPQGERVMFFFADSYFQIGDYYLSGYQFERFVKSYPNSDKMQQASFLGAKSYYELSPRYSLDQTDTDKALSRLQAFINTYPDSEYFDEANKMAAELTTKKELKQFEIAKQFDKLGEFDFTVLISAITALDNFITENPGSIYREDAFYYKLKSSTNLALNSTTIKKKERLEEAVAAYNALKRSYPETKYGKEADALYKKLMREMQDFSK